MARSKARRNGTLAWILGILLVAVIAGGSVYVFSVNGDSNSGESTPTQTTPQGQVAFCSSETTPDLTINAYDADNVGTAITEIGIYRKSGTNTWNAFNTGSAITNLEGGEEYEFVLGINTSDTVDNAYGDHFTHVIKCQETEAIEMAMFNDEIETSLSATFYNKDNDAAAQTFSAGDEFTVSLRLKSGSDEYFGNPTLGDAPNVLVLKLNQSDWDTPNEVYAEVPEVGSDGTVQTKVVALDRISLPQRYTAQASGFTEYVYELPVIGDREMTVFLSLDADDSNAPGSDGTAYIYAANYYINDDGMVAFGIEDEEGVAVGTDAADTVTLDFTA